MLCRARIVQARLNPEEFERYAPLVAHTFDRTWSDLIRRALMHLWKEEIGEPSDNGVIQTNGQTKSPASKSRAKKKPTRRVPSRRGKSAVKH